MCTQRPILTLRPKEMTKAGRETINLSGTDRTNTYVQELQLIRN